MGSTGGMIAEVAAEQILGHDCRSRSRADPSVDEKGAGSARVSHQSHITSVRSRVSQVLQCRGCLSLRAVLRLKLEERGVDSAIATLDKTVCEGSVA